MASTGHARACASACFIRNRPTPSRWNSGSTAMPVRYSGRRAAVKYEVSMAQGFFVASRSVPIMRPRARATRIRSNLGRRIWFRMALSDCADDQNPCPNRRVSSAEAAVCSPASSDASESRAASRTSFILDHHLRLRRNHLPPPQPLFKLSPSRVGLDPEARLQLPLARHQRLIERARPREVPHEELVQPRLRRRDLDASRNQRDFQLPGEHAASALSSRAFLAAPQRYPPVPPPAGTTRWHGITS